jgi:hypothetical protein
MIAHAPRCPAVVQEELRSAAERHGFALVDLPRLFGPLPDRTLFLDYCHLTGDGLKKVTTAIGEALAPTLGVKPAAPFEPGARTAARAHLLAAVHNAHYGQPAGTVAHHAAAARDLDPQIRDVVSSLVEFVCRQGEPWLGRGWEALRAEPQVRRYLGSPEMLRAPRVADAVLADALAAAIGRNGLVDQVLTGETAETPLDLLAPRHRAATFREAVGQGLGPPAAYVRATAPISRFLVVRPDVEELTARITLRAFGNVAVFVNGVRAGVLPAGNAWQTFEIRLSLVRGRNMIELRWPAPQPDAARVFERAARRLERGLYPDVLVAFGEVYAFTAA